MKNSLSADSKLEAPGSGLVLGLGRAPEIVAFESSVVDFFVDAAELFGVPKSVAAIYGIVFASPAPLSFADIESRLDISKGSVSQGLRILREVGALKAVSPEPGAMSGKPNGSGSRLAAQSSQPEAETPVGRGVSYEPDLEMRQLIQRFLEQRVQRQLAGGKSRLDALNRAVPELEADEMGALRARLKQLQNWHDRARALLPVMKAFLKLS